MLAKELVEWYHCIAESEDKCVHTKVIVSVQLPLILEQFGGIPWLLGFLIEFTEIKELLVFAHTSKSIPAVAHWDCDEILKVIHFTSPFQIF